MKIRVLRSTSGNAKSEIHNSKFLFFFCALLFALGFPAVNVVYRVKVAEE
jgi:hypothetical protein